MKVHIDKQESSEGLIFKKKIYEMYVKAELSQEELEAYDKVSDEIGNMIIAEYSYQGTELNFRIRDFVYQSKKGSGRGMRFVVGAQHELGPLEDKIKEGAKGLSGYLKKVMAGGSTGQETVEF